MMKKHHAWLTGTAILLIMVGLQARSAAPAVSAIQALADVTAIDAHCRSVTTDFGIVFKYVEHQGIVVSDLMPSGPRRSEFRAAYERRLKETLPDDLCGRVAHGYAAMLPGLLTPR